MDANVLVNAVLKNIFVEMEASGRHVHVTEAQAKTLFGHPLTPEDAVRFGVRDKQIVKLQTYTDRPLIFEDVLVRVSKDFATRVHLDVDEANACGYRTGDLGRILS